MKILQLFNRYRERGGEEKSAERIFRHAGDLFEMDRLWWDSRDWDAPGGPGKLGQLRRLFGNEDSAAEVRTRIAEFQPDALLCHNLYPVGSPAVYREACRASLPVIQFVHNFRPFSVGGSLWTGERVAEESLRGDYRAEIAAGAWQDSRLKSAVFALVLKRLHASGWLDSVRAWVCISEFVRDRFLEAGLPEDRVYALRHSWDRRESEPVEQDNGSYLFLSRLVPEKGVRVLLEAWDLLREKLGDKTPGLRIGGTGSEEEVVRKAAARNPAVEFLGFVSGEDKEREVAGCRAMLAPSVWWEPLGLVTYEAYDHGKPMLAAASGGLTETVRDGETGIVYRPNDARALADGVLRLESLTPAERRAMGLRGRAWLAHEANPAQWKQRFASIVRKVVES